MSLADLVQLYAPLAGLLVLAFWVGGLSQRVKTLEKESVGDDLKERVIRVEERQVYANEKLDSLDRGIAGLNRQLANIATKQFAGLGSEPK